MILPAYNEEDTLSGAVVAIRDGLEARERRHAPAAGLADRAPGGPAPADGTSGAGGYEILVVENGSTDGTRRVLAALVEAGEGVRSILLPRADYGEALRAGLLDVRGSEWAVFNVDYYDLGFLDAALAALSPGGGADLVLATKRGRGAHDERGWFRRVATQTFTGLTHLLLGVRASDTHGMKVGSTAALRPVIERCTSRADLFDTELVARAERAGLRTAEIPVTVAETRPARTSLTRRVPRTLAGLWRLRRSLAREGSG